MFALFFAPFLNQRTCSTVLETGCKPVLYLTVTQLNSQCTLLVIWVSDLPCVMSTNSDFWS